MFNTSIYVLLVSYFIKGFFTTLLPFTTLTLFDTAIPAKSMYSILVLLVIALYCSVSAYYLQLRCENQAKSLSELTQADLISNIDASSKQYLSFVQSTLIFIVSEFLWVVLILLFLAFFFPLATIMVLSLTTLIIVISLVFGNSFARAAQSFTTYLLIFGSALLVIVEGSNIGIITFMMFTGARIVTTLTTVFTNLNNLKISLQNVDVSKVLKYEYIANFNKKSKSTLRYSLLLFTVSFALLLFPIQRVSTSIGNSIVEGQKIDVNSPFSGKITEAFIVEGQKIKQGDLLLSLYSDAKTKSESVVSELFRLESEAKQLYTIQEEIIETRKEKYDTTQAKFKQKKVVIDEVLNAKSNYQEAELRLIQTKADYNTRMASLRKEIQDYRSQLELSNLKSPVDGTIDSSILLYKDLTVNSNHFLFSIVPDGNIVIETFASPLDREYFQEGKPVILTVNTIGNRNYTQITGTIYRSSKIIDQKTGQFKILIKPETSILTGESFTVRAAISEVTILTWLTQSFAQSVGYLR